MSGTVDHCNCCGGCQIFLDGFEFDPFEEGTRYTLDDPSDWIWTEANTWITSAGTGPLHFGNQPWSVGFVFDIPTGGSLTLSAGSGSFFDVTIENTYSGGTNHRTYKLNGVTVHDTTSGSTPTDIVGADGGARLQAIHDGVYSFSMGRTCYEFSRTQTWDWTISGTSGVKIKQLSTQRISPECYEDCNPCRLQLPSDAPESINVTSSSFSRTWYDGFDDGDWTYSITVPATVLDRILVGGSIYTGPSPLYGCAASEDQAPCISSDTDSLLTCHWSYYIIEALTEDSGTASFVGTGSWCECSTPVEVTTTYQVEFVNDPDGVLGGDPGDVWIFVCRSIGMMGLDCSCVFAFLPPSAFACGQVNLGGRVDWSSLSESVNLYNNETGTAEGSVTISA